MKIALIYNGIGVAGFNPDRPRGDREGSWISHGLASIGASVKKAGYDVELVDMRQLEGYHGLSYHSDVYGISISAVDYHPALKTILFLKKNNPRCKIIIGGIHPSIFPGKYKFKAIDTIVVGEGEITFVKLLKMIEEGKELPEIIDGEKPDLDEIPFVDREMFDYKRELFCQYTPLDTPSITMIAGRGCPYKCTYCQPAENQVFGKPFRMRSPQNVMDELEELKRYNYKSITFWDDTFTFKKSWVMEFCDLYDLKAGMNVCSRADIICKNEDMVKRLSEKGVRWMTIGFESGSQRLLDLIKKGTTVEQNIEAAKICKKHGIKIFATYMYGLPTERPDESQMTYDMIKEIKPEHNSPFFFLPIEGTEIYDYCDRNQFILPEAKDRSIARTGSFLPTIKGVDYDRINKLLRC